MTDKELLELAAKAAALERTKGGYINDRFMPVNWNPLKDASDTLSLIVRLELSIEYHDGYVIVETKDGGSVSQELGHNPFDATRRAIVRAAAEIGKDMK